jgi:uncharacterized membrane protein YkvA (DUF1232 family)
MLDGLKNKAKLLKTDTYALYLAFKDPRIPWYARILAVCVVAYAFSPIDLIPDQIPVLGYLDDLILVPLGIVLILRMIPKEVLDEYRIQAKVNMLQGKHVNWVVASVIIGIWVVLAILGIDIVSRYFCA